MTITQSRTIAWYLVALAGGSLSSCGSGTPPQGSVSPALPGARAQTADFMPTQTVKRDPCAWISVADAERALGNSLLSEPTRILSAENPITAPQGEACLYQLKNADPLQKSIAVQVSADDSGLLQTSFINMGNVDPLLRGREAHGESAIEGRWDFVSAVPGGLTAMGRGRIAMQLTSSPSLTKQAMALAAAILDQTPDIPFSQDPSDPVVPPVGRDPCALVPRASAESVLGPLGVVPYRSRKGTALAYGSGASCSYFTGQHRALVLTPTWSHAKVLLQLSGGAETLVASVEGGAHDVRISRGQWDQITFGPDGALHALKGDAMIALQYKSANLSIEQAVRFLNLAFRGI